MKLAITCEGNQVFQHFGHTPEFAVFEIENGKIVSESRKSTGGTGHGALAGLLAAEQIDLLICGGIGFGAINALTQAGIQTLGGAEGNVREVAEKYLAGNLNVREDFHCRRHGENHQCGNHGENHVSEHCGGERCAKHNDERSEKHSCGGGCGRRSEVVKFR